MKEKTRADGPPLLKRRIVRELNYNGQLYILLLPAILYFLVFCYFPMYGVQIAFKNFNPVLGIEGSRFVGLKYFIRFFNSYQFSIIIKNTLILSLYNIFAGFPIAIILAIIINQMRRRRLKSFLQTVAFAPHFISIPAMVGIIIIMLAPGTGILYKLISSVIGKDPGVILGNPKVFSSIYAWSGIWQNMGWESIIYTAVLTSINPELYQAADIDGAGKFRKILSIDLPALMPTAITMLILNCGKMLSVGFEKVFLMQNSIEPERLRGDFNLCLQGGTGGSRLQLLHRDQPIQFRDQFDRPDRGESFREKNERGKSVVVHDEE